MFVGMGAISRGLGEELTVAGLSRPILVQVPGNYDPGEVWPVMYFWPGPNGVATTRTVTPACEKRDWIIVGMTFTERELLQVTRERMAAEVAALRRVRPLVEEAYSVDPGRVFVGGYFTGGWVAAEALSDDATLAGALLIGSGFLDHQALPVQQAVRGKPVYVGVGSVYTNHLMGLRAVKRFRGAGAQVTWDAWDFLGKAVPKDFEDYPGMRQWLRLYSGKERGEGFREVAQAWGRERLLEIGSIPHSGERYVAMKRFVEQPFLAVFGAGAVAAVEEQMAAFAKSDPEAAREAELWRQYEVLLQLELRDRSRSSLERCLADYEEIMANGEGSVTARLAEAEHARLSKVLGR